MRCHACQHDTEIPAGASVGFRDECDTCQADLHVCLNCAHHDPTAYNECRESSAERVLDRDRANRCDWFRPGTGSTDGGGARSKALSDLDRLFKKD